VLPAGSLTRRSSLTTTRSTTALIGDWRGQIYVGTLAEPGEVEGIVGVAVAARVPAGSRFGHVQPVFGVSTTSGIWRLVFVLVAGVALVHLHKAGEQLAALGGIGGLGADGKLLGADLELGSAGGAQVVVPGGMVRGAAVGGA
jgi:hypothetical protein